MDNEVVKQLIDRAGELEGEEDYEKAIKQYSEVLDILVASAKEYAQLAGPGVIDAVIGTGTISDQYLIKFNDYLKRDKTAAAVSNSMGMLFAKTGNKASAKAFFEQAIDLTPDGIVYDDPHIGLEMLKNLQ